MRRLNLEDKIIALFEAGLLLDAEDMDLLLLPALKIASDGYVSYHSDHRAYRRLHRLILSRKEGREISKGELCDHINGNILDNRRKNLRIATHRDNMRNRHTVRGKSGFFGVYQNLKNGRFITRIQGKVNGRKVLHHISCHATAIDAAKAYNEAAKRLGFLTRNTLPETH